MIAIVDVSIAAVAHCSPRPHFPFRLQNIILVDDLIYLKCILIRYKHRLVILWAVKQEA